MTRLAIVGTGGMADYQARKFAEIGDCAITACADRNADHARDFARRFDIPYHCDAIRTLLDHGGFDAATCSVIDSQHARICEAILGRSLPVFCEKPLARGVAECERLARLAAVTPVPALVNFSKRNAPALHALKAVLDEGELGAIESVDASYLQDWVASSRWGDWKSMPRWKWRLLPSESSSGVAGDLGSHLVDALLFLFGSLSAERPGKGLSLVEAMDAGFLPAEALPAEFMDSAAAPPLVEFTARATLPGGIPLTLRASWIERGAADVFAISVRGSKGIALLDLAKSRASIEIRPAAAEMAGAPSIRRDGPAIPSTYERFIELTEAHIAGARRVRAAADTDADVDAETGANANADADYPTFERGLEVMRVLDSLIPGGLPK
ncbi:MAG: Gfo/Idh/MocA family protein [Spirochaetales bacterium]